MLRNIFFNFSLYTLTSVLCGLLNVLILPVLTSHLSEKDYGTTALFSTFVMILSPLIGVSSGGYFWMEFFRNPDKLRQQKLFSSYFWFTAACCVAAVLVCLGLYPLFESSAYFSLFFILLIPFTSFISVIGDESRSYFINRKMPMAYLCYSVILTALELILSWYLIVKVFHNWEGRIYGWLIALIIQFFFTIFLFAGKGKLLNLTFSKEDLFRLLAFGTPLILHQLGKFVVNQSDRIFITEMVSIDEAGVYSIGYQVGSMLLLPVGAFANYFSPFVYERMPQLNQEKKIEIVKASYFFVLVILICFIGLLVVTPLFFDLLIDRKFHAAVAYVPWVALSYVFWGFYLVLSVSIFYLNKTALLGWMSLLNIALNGLLNYALIKAYGPLGAAWATVLSFFVIFVITLFFSHRFFPLPWFYFLKK